MKQNERDLPNKPGNM